MMVSSLFGVAKIRVVEEDHDTLFSTNLPTLEKKEV